MKTYNQFVAESYSARENIQEIAPALALLPAAGKALGYGFAAYQAYQAAQKLRKGDYGGAAVDAALAVPSARVATGLGRVFKWGQRGKNIATNTLRTGKAAAITADALREPPAETKPASSTQPASSTKPVQTKPAVQPKPSSVVLARKGGVMGKLDKATGKWTKGDWTKQESDRYKRVAAQKAAATAPKPAPVVRSNNINLPSGVTPKPVVKKSVPVGDTIKTKVNPDSSLEVTQKRSKAATEKIKKSLDIN